MRNTPCRSFDKGYFDNSVCLIFDKGDCPFSIFVMGQTLLSKKGQTHFTFWFFETNLNSDQFRLIFVFF